MIMKHTIRRKFAAAFTLLLAFAATNAWGQCLVPSGLSTTNITNTSAKLNWATTTADSFLVRYNVSGSTAYLYKTVKPGTSTNTTITGLYPNLTYQWQVRTWCNNGSSGAYQTTPASFTTLNQSVACVPPNLNVTSNITANGATLTWSNLITADSFMVRYNVRNTTNYVWVKTPGSVRTLTLTGLLPNTSYDWAVRCICASAPSQAYSSTNTFTTLSSSCGTADVAYFSSTLITHNSATVGWRSVSGALSYNVRYAVRYSGNWTTVTTTTNSRALSGLQPTTWYEFQVQTVCSSGAGNWSSSGIFQTTTATLSISRGPYLQQANTSSIFIRWRTNIASDTRVRYGTSSSSLNLSVSNSTQLTEHVIQLTGLAPNTKYFYSVGTSTTTLQGDTGNYFYTHPAVGSTGAVRIWATGDFGVNTSNQRAVRDSYRNYTGSTHTNVWLWLGDNAYNDGTDSEYQTNVFNQYPYQFKKWVVWPSSGNHDLHTANSALQTGPYYDNFTMPKAGEVGGVASGTEAYYSFNYANIHFVCLESYSSAYRSSTGAMATWLTNDLSANTQRWTIVYFHHPPYSKGSHNSDTETELIEMRQNIMPILEAKKVDLVLSGHSHSYERSMLIRGHFGLESTFNTSTMAVNSGSGIAPSVYTKTSPNYYGTVYAVVGVSGQKGSTTSGYPHNAMYTSSVTYYGSAVIDVVGNQLNFKFLTSAGSIWDQFTIQKTGSVTPVASDPSQFVNDYPASTIYDIALYPNPILDDATVEFRLSKDARVRLDILDLNGRIVYSTGSEEELPAGHHRLPLNLADADLPKGIYLLRLSGEGMEDSRRFVLQ
jgi:hypothetical protein